MAIALLACLLLASLNDIRSSDDQVINEDNPSDWPMFKHDSKNSGFQENASFENNGYLRWKTRIYGTISLSSPIIVGNHVYIGSVKSEHNPTTGLYCINLSGEINWMFETDGWISSSPTFSDSKIF
ncbi:MAG: hypothetical protein R6V01_07010, partial [Thermoplasmatota archaeon]